MASSDVSKYGDALLAQCSVVQSLFDVGFVIIYDMRCCVWSYVSVSCQPGVSHSVPVVSQAGSATRQVCRASRVCVLHCHFAFLFRLPNYSLAWELQPFFLLLGCKVEGLAAPVRLHPHGYLGLIRCHALQPPKLESTEHCTPLSYVFRDLLFSEEYLFLVFNIS